VTSNIKEDLELLTYFIQKTWKSLLLPQYTTSLPPKECRKFCKYFQTVAVICI